MGLTGVTMLLIGVISIRVDLPSPPGPPTKVRQEFECQPDWTLKPQP